MTLPREAPPSLRVRWATFAPALVLLFVLSVPASLGLGSAHVLRGAPAAALADSPTPRVVPARLLPVAQLADGRATASHLPFAPFVRGGTPTVASTLVLGNDSARSGNFVAPDCAGPEGATFDWRDDLLFVPCYWSDTVAVFSPTTLSLVAYIPVSSNPSSVVYASGTDQLYVDTGAFLTVISASTRTVTGLLNTPTLPGFGYDPVDQDLYLVGYYGDNVSLLSTVTQALVGEVRVGADPEAVTWDPVQEEMFSSNSGSSNLSAISSTTMTVVGTVAVGTAPGPGAWDPATGELYVIDQGSGNITGVDPSSLTGIVSFPTTGDVIALTTDAESGDLYYVSYDSSNLTSFYPSPSPLATTIQVGLYPWGLTNLSSPHEVLVANELSDSLSAVDPLSGSLLSTVPTGDAPSEMAYDPTDGDLYIAQGGENSVEVVNPSNGAELATIPVGEFPDYVLADGPYVFVANVGSNSVTVIRTATGSVSTLGAGRQPVGLAVDNGSGVDDLLVANEGSDNVTCIILQPFDDGTCSLPAGSAPSAVAFDPNSDQIFVADSGTDELTVFNGASSTILGTIPVGVDPQVLLDYPTSSELFVANALSANVSVVDTSDDHVAYTISTGALPDALAIDPGSHSLYVAAGESDAVYYGPQLASAPQGSVAVGDLPDGLAYDPTTSTVFAVNYGSGTLTTFGPSPYADTVAFQVDPAVCADDEAIALNGTSEANGTTSALEAGTYTAVAPACPGATFGGWAGSGGVLVTAPDSPSTSVVVSGNGTLTALYGFYASLSISVVPSGCGPITVGSNSFPNGGTASLLEGNTYELGSSSCAGYTFVGWTTEGAVSVASPSHPDTTVIVSGTGATITANFVRSTYTVNLQVNGGGCGTILLNGSLYAGGQVVQLFPDTEYTLIADPCGNYDFLEWVASDGVYVSTTSSEDTQVLVESNGSLTADFAPVIDLSVNVAGCYGYLNGAEFSQGSTAIATGLYPLEAEECLGYNFVQWNSTGGVSVTDRDESETEVSIVGTGSLTADYERNNVDTPISLIASGTPTSGLAPLSASFVATIIGGESPYTLSWSFDDGVHEEQTTYGTEESTIHTFDDAGNYQVFVTVTDAGGEGANAQVTITVSSPTTHPSTSYNGMQGLEVSAGVLAVLLVASVAWVVLLRRRRSPPELFLPPMPRPPPGGP